MIDSLVGLQSFIFKAAISFTATSILSFTAYSLTMYAKTIGPIVELNPITRYLMSIQGNTFYIQLLCFAAGYLAIIRVFWSDRDVAEWLFLVIPLVILPDPLHDALLVYGLVQFSPMENFYFLVWWISTGVVLSVLAVFPSFRCRVRSKILT